VLLVAPGVYHRVRWREANKNHVMRVGNVFAVTGTSCLAVSMASAVFVVTDMMFGVRFASVCTAGVALSMVALWYVLPMWARYAQLGTRRGEDEDERGEDPSPSERRPRPARRRRTDRGDAPRAASSRP
jgi:hypothetical protein